MRYYQSAILSAIIVSLARGQTTTSAPSAAPVTSTPTITPTAAPVVATNAPTTETPSNVPSYVPSDVPSDAPSVSPSSLPSSVPSTSPIAPPIDGDCESVCSDTYSSLEKIQMAVSLARGAGTICLCPSSFTPNDVDACPEQGDEATPSIYIAQGQDITIKCVSQLGAQCVFGCPSPVIRVGSGGSLTFLGGGNTLMTGGLLYSRIHVDNGGSATIDGVVFSDTASGSETRRRRLENEVPADGIGGGITSFGKIEVKSSIFDSCSASLYGGAMYVAGNTKVYNSSFTNNNADTGGAIYAENGTQYFENNLFQDNTASEVGDNIAGEAVFDGCGNQGLTDVQPCDDSSATRFSSMVAFTTLLGAMALL